ncbi:hypothetical protein HDU97_004616 [Phlyctochytrium planicorne]|nr:hypothetical protein HDU97_004616 [Phlyctochytrium planicorne]
MNQNSYNFRQSLQFAGETPNFLQILKLQSSSGVEKAVKEAQERASEGPEDDEMPTVVIQEGLKEEEVANFIADSAEKNLKGANITSDKGKGDVKDETTKPNLNAPNSKIQKRKKETTGAKSKPKISKADKNKKLLSFEED